MAYRDLVNRLGERTATKVENLYAAWQAGNLTDDALTAALVAVIGSANLRATALADLGLAATLTAKLGRPVPPVTEAPPDETDRLRKAATTLVAALAATPDALARIARLGRSEPLSAAQKAYSDGVARSPHVIGWTRGTSPGACELCQWWAKDGARFPPKMEMAHHPGCTCTQLIITR